MKELDFNGIKFDDFVVDKEGGVWSQVCISCFQKMEVNSARTDNSGSGICGVKGCSDESDTYVDWAANEVTIKEEE